MKINRFFHSLIALIAITSAAQVSATPTLLVNSGGILIGAQRVDVNGIMYDVKFVDGTCSSIFGGCDANMLTFHSQEEADKASRALLDQVFLDGPMGNFDAAGNNTFGCTTTALCQTYIPYSVRKFSTFIEFDTSIAQNYYDGFPIAFDDLVNDFYNRSGLFFDTSVNPGGATANFAVFTVSELDSSDIPEPSSIALMGLALTGLLINRRRKS